MSILFLGETLQCLREEENKKDRFAVVVYKDINIVGYVPRAILILCSVFPRHGGMAFVSWVMAKNLRNFTRTLLTCSKNRKLFQRAIFRTLVSSMHIALPELPLLQVYHQVKSLCQRSKMSVHLFCQIPVHIFH